MPTGEAQRILRLRVFGTFIAKEEPTSSYNTSSEPV
jgi:hypothetical protein